MNEDGFVIGVCERRIEGESVWGNYQSNGSIEWISIGEIGLAGKEWNVLRGGDEIEN